MKRMTNTTARVQAEGQDNAEKAAIVDELDALAAALYGVVHTLPRDVLLPAAPTVLGTVRAALDRLSASAEAIRALADNVGALHVDGDRDETAGGRNIIGSGTSARDQLMMTAGEMISKLGKDAALYADLFAAHMADALRGHGVDNVGECRSAAGMCSDLLLAVGYNAELSMQFCEMFIDHVLYAVARPDLDTRALPQLLGLIGDIAMGMGAAFNAHFARVAAVLEDVVSHDDPGVRLGEYDDVYHAEFVAEVRESCAEAYTGVLMSILKVVDGVPQSRDAVDMAKTTLPAVARLLVNTLRDVRDNGDPESDDTRRFTTAMGLLLDLVSYFGNDALASIGRGVVEEAMIKAAGRSEPGHDLHKLAARLGNRVAALG